MSLSPYREVAASANVSWWLGLTDEQIRTMSYEELENNCWATSSMMSAIDRIAEVLELNDEQKQRFVDSVFAKDHVEVSEYDKVVFADIQKKWKEKVVKNPEVVVDVLSAVHDNWVKENAKKFNFVLRDSSKYQHLPIELIGFEEAELDLLFVNPILNAIGSEVSREKLKNAYDKRVKRYFASNNINSPEELANLIAKGHDFYAPLQEKNSAKNTFVFDEETMAFLRAHKKDKRIKNLRYPDDLSETENFANEVQEIVDAIETEESAEKHVTVKTNDVSREEEARKIASQAIQKLELDKQLEETENK